MGGSASINDTLKKTLDDVVMENIYNMTTTCETNQNQTQNMILDATGDINVGTISQD
jgi:hypothetical protein